MLTGKGSCTHTTTRRPALALPILRRTPTRMPRCRCLPMPPTGGLTAHPMDTPRRTRRAAHHAVQALQLNQNRALGDVSHDGCFRFLFFSVAISSCSAPGSGVHLPCVAYCSSCPRSGCFGYPLLVNLVLFFPICPFISSISLRHSHPASCIFSRYVSETSGMGGHLPGLPAA